MTWLDLVFAAGRSTIDSLTKKEDFMKKVIALFLLFLFLFPNQGFVLSCVEPSPPDVAYGEYDGVIIGTVQKINENHRGKVLTIKVHKSFKGVNEKIILAKEDVTWGESRLNMDSLFFLNKEGESWVHPVCSPTTQNTNIANEFFADKEEIVLQDVDIKDNESKAPILLSILTAIVVLAAAVFGAIRRKGNK